MVETTVWASVEQGKTQWKKYRSIRGWNLALTNLQFHKMRKRRVVVVQIIFYREHKIQLRFQTCTHNYKHKTENIVHIRKKILAAEKRFDIPVTRVYTMSQHWVSFVFVGSKFNEKELRHKVFDTGDIPIILFENIFDTQGGPSQKTMMSEGFLHPIHCEMMVWSLIMSHITWSDLGLVIGHESYRYRELAPDFSPKSIPESYKCLGLAKRLLSCYDLIIHSWNKTNPHSLSNIKAVDDPPPHFWLLQSAQRGWIS